VIKNNVFEFKPGQLWEYKTRKGEAKAKLLIIRVEKNEEQSIVHIAIVGDSDSPSHMPFSEKAIRQSVTVLSDDKYPFQHYMEGYWYWKEKYKAGEAGVYDLPVSEALGL